MTPKKVTPCMMPRGLWPLHSLVREALIAHEAAEVAAVRDEAGHPDAQVVVDLEELSLELAQLCGGSLYGCQHDVRVALAMQAVCQLQDLLEQKNATKCSLPPASEGQGQSQHLEAHNC